MFAAGLVVGFIAGARAGRERYDQLVSLGRKVAGHPAVQKSTHAATAKATDLTKTAAARAPGLAKAATARMPFAGKGANSKTAREEANGVTGAQVPPQPDSGTAASYNGVPAE